MESIFRLKGQVRSDAAVDPADIVRTKEAFAELGHYKTPDYGIKPFTDDEMFEAIRAFQAEHKLRVDSQIFPSGETERTVNRALRRKQRPDDRPTNSDRSPPFIHDPIGLGIERNDPAGAGHFSASRDGGTRKHEALDLKAEPGSVVVAPIDGVLVKRGKVYGDNEELRYVDIRGTGKYRGMKARMLYVTADEWPPDGARVEGGKTIVGSSQDVAAARGYPSMKPHVHLRIEWDNKRIDPAKLIPAWNELWEKPKR